MFQHRSRPVVAVAGVQRCYPFNHRALTGNVGDTLMLDSVNLTMGAHIVLPRSVIGGAVGVPLAWGPQRIEALATYTLKY